ncbi:MAG: hypothetical protein P8127_10855 [Acidobacteriota bacterium]
MLPVTKKKTRARARVMWVSTSSKDYREDPASFDASLALASATWPEVVLASLLSQLAFTPVRSQLEPAVLIMLA